jgi:asparagine synthase (glutamine-hydrolysing)
VGSILAFLSRVGPPDPTILQTMAAAAPHRGATVRTIVHGRAVLGTSAGDGVGDADVAVDGEMAAAFVGDFDNIAQLATALARTGPFDAGSPAEVLLAAFRRFGTEAPARMRGVFAGVVSDGRTLWAFRDHVGFQPLFFRDEPRGVFVATEIKQVVAGARIAYEPDEEALTNLFHVYAHSETDDRRCAIRGVERVPRASILIAGDYAARVHRYWAPERCLETSRPGPGELQEQFHALMTQAVERSLRGNDVISLSGGVDSPTLAAYAAPVHLRKTGRPLPALSGLYPKYPSVDEERYIRAVSAALDLSLHTYESDVKPTDGLLEWVRLFDGPVPVMSLGGIFDNLSRARALGFRNVITGEFAEFVCDMSHFALDYLLARGRMSAALRYARVQYQGPEGFARAGRRAVRAWLPPGVVSRYRRLRPRPDPAAIPWMDPRRAPALREFAAAETWRDDQLTAFQGAFPAIEADSFVQSVAGVGTRRPWTDVDLWEFFLGLPAEAKHPGPQRKGLVRSLVRGRVPDLILDRQDKTVFDAAITAWIDYDVLDRWLLSPGHRIAGVRYDLLADRLRQRDLTLLEYMRAKDLAAVHAFLSLC